VLVLRRLRIKLVLAHSQCCVEVAVSSFGLVISSESLDYLNLRTYMRPVNLHFLHAGRSNFSFVSLSAAKPQVLLRWLRRLTVVAWEEPRSRGL
jgi:hypothetical protein